MDIDSLYHFKEKIEEGKKSVDLIIPILNEAYDDIQFERVDNGGEADRLFSIDLKAIFPNKTETWAVKIRQPYSHDFDDITVEIMNGDNTRGDFYRFNGGIISKYIYGWRENEKLYDIHICDAKKLVRIPKEYWKGNIQKDFSGLGNINCYRNGKYGKSWFTTIALSDLRYNFPTVVDVILNKQKQIEITTLEGWC